MQNVPSSGNAEVVINENFVNVLWAEVFGRNPLTTTGLTWGYVGGEFPISGLMTTFAAGTVALTASVTNYVGLSQAGVVVNTITTRNPIHIPLFTVVTGASTITSYTDTRSAANLQAIAYGFATLAVTTANVTLTQAQALSDMLEITGALTAQRDVIVPLLRRSWTVRHNGTAFPVRFIGASGTGVVVDIGQRAIIECDGTNVYFPLSSITVTPLQATTSGTSIDFTAIPANAKRITINLVGVSTSGTSPVIVQIGDSGGVEATGYTSAAASLNTISTGAYNSSTTGMVIDSTTAATDARHGAVVLTLQDAATFTWCCSGNVYSSGARVAFVAGSKSLSATLDRVRLTTTNGTDTFDAGSVNIVYE